MGILGGRSLKHTFAELNEFEGGMAHPTSGPARAMTSAKSLDHRGREIMGRDGLNLGGII